VALPTWDTVVSELTQLGFKQILYLEISCRHGDSRGAMLADSESPPVCPSCGEAFSVAILARGLTRSPETPWKLISPALPAAWKIDTDYQNAPNRYSRVWSRKRCDAFFRRARRELAGVR
jgi:hypothetical protein